MQKFVSLKEERPLLYTLVFIKYNKNLKLAYLDVPPKTGEWGVFRAINTWETIPYKEVQKWKLYLPDYFKCMFLGEKFHNLYLKKC